MLLTYFAPAALLAALGYGVFCGWSLSCLAVFAEVFAGCHILYLVLLMCFCIGIHPSKPLEAPYRRCLWAAKDASRLLCFYGRVRVTVEGREKLEGLGNALYVANHRSIFDPLAVMAQLPEKHIAFVSKSSNMRIPFIGTLAYGAGYLPINREDNREALKTILTAASYIKHGMCSVMIYPEGTRNLHRENDLLPFHAGSFKIAQRAACPLVILSERNTGEIRRNFPWRRTDVTIRVLEVLDAERVRSMSTNELADYTVAVLSADLGIPAKEEREHA